MGIVLSFVKSSDPELVFPLNDSGRCVPVVIVSGNSSTVKVGDIAIRTDDNYLFLQTDGQIMWGTRGSFTENMTARNLRPGEAVTIKGT